MDDMAQLLELIARRSERLQGDQTSLADHLRPPFPTPMPQILPLTRGASDAIMGGWQNLPSEYQTLARESPEQVLAVSVIPFSQQTTPTDRVSRSLGQYAEGLRRGDEFQGMLSYPLKQAGGMTIMAADQPNTALHEFVHQAMRSPRIQNERLGYGFLKPINTDQERLAAHVQGKDYPDLLYTPEDRKWVAGRDKAIREYVRTRDLPWWRNIFSR